MKEKLKPTKQEQSKSEQQFLIDGNGDEQWLLIDHDESTKRLTLPYDLEVYR